MIEKAVTGMLPKNRLKKLRLKRLKTYKQADHDHQAQQPMIIKVNKEG